MGNVLAIDMGVLMMRIMLFDRDNFIQPSRKCVQENYFDFNSSIYSIEHGGTFHFL